ncbi:MAG: DUF177 domain-containing protein [Roseinatronobacter sp.]|nr:DUF177 domain-containing protein [Roseinatronobacter sp.]
MSSSAPSITALSLMAPLRVAQLAGRKGTQIDLQPDAATRAQIAQMLGLEGLRKFRFTAKLQPFGKSDWEVIGTLGATVVQPCAVTLEPVSTRIDERVTRRFLAHMPIPEGLEVEMPEDDTLEPLGAEIDISAIALEALSLALPPFPRAPAALEGPEIVLESRPIGAAPLEPEQTKPFAALAGLRAKLGAQAKPGPEEPE